MKRKIRQRKGVVNEGSKNRVFVVFVFTLIVFVVFQIISAIQASSLAARLSQLEKEKIKLQTINKDYSYEILRSNSLSKLAKRSEELGFSEPQDTVFLQLEESVAQVQR